MPELRPYQSEGVRFMHEKFRQGFPGVPNHDDMGLGKTPQTLGLINAEPSFNLILIVCPDNAVSNWKREAAIWLERPVVVRVINYEKAPLLLRYLELIRWDIIVLDEYQYVKNRQANRTDAVLSLPSRFMVWLSGTPMDKVRDLWTMVNQCVPGYFGSTYEQFADRYCNRRLIKRKVRGGKTRQVWDDSGYSNLGEFRAKMAHVAIRRHTRDVLGELPPLEKQVVELPPTGCANLIKKELARWNQLVEKYSFEVAVARLQAEEGVEFQDMSKLRKEVAQAKIRPCVDYIKQVMQQQDKVVLFAYHIETVNTLMQELAEFNPVKVVGGLGSDEKGRAVDIFQNDPKCRVFIGNLRAASTAITLTSARYVAFVEFSWAQVEMDQAMKRIHRFGQEYPCLAQFLTLPDSLDANMLQRVAQKTDVARRAIG